MQPPGARPVANRVSAKDCYMEDNILYIYVIIYCNILVYLLVKSGLSKNSQR